MRRIFLALSAAIATIASPAFAATLDPAQRLTLRADVLADPALSALSPSPDNAALIAAAYAASPSVPCTVWRTMVPPGEYREAIVWTAVDSLTVGKARIWEWLTQGMTSPVDASKTNVRQGIADAFGANSATGIALSSVAKRSANRLEKLFSSGACSVASPSTMQIEGSISYEEVILAMGW